MLAVSPLWATSSVKDRTPDGGDGVAALERLARAEGLDADRPELVALEELDEAARRQRLQQPVGRGRRQAGALGEVGERDAVARRQHVEQGQRAVERLHGAVDRGRAARPAALAMHAGCGLARFRRKCFPFSSSENRGKGFFPRNQEEAVFQASSENLFGKIDSLSRADHFARNGAYDAAGPRRAHEHGREERSQGRARAPRLPRQRRAARLRYRRGDLLQGPRRARRRLRRAQSRAACRARRPSNEDRRLARGQSRQGFRPGRLSRLPQGRRLPASPADAARDPDRQRRRGDRRHRRPAAGGADQQRALRAQCRQRPLGQPLRRALRHRRHPRGSRRREARQLQSRARRPRRCRGQGGARPRRAAACGIARERHALPGREPQARGVVDRRRRDDACATPASSTAIAARRATPV